VDNALVEPPGTGIADQQVLEESEAEQAKPKSVGRSTPSKNASGKAQLPDELDIASNTTIRLQRQIHDETRVHSITHGYTRETFLEAAWLKLQQHPDLLQQVVSEAKRRATLRRERGRTKAAKTFSKRFQED